MLATVVLLLLCILTAIAGVPLILRLIPPNDIYGVHTERVVARAETWYEVNWFAGWALVAAAALTALALMFYNNTLLRPVWLQLLAFVLLVGVAVGASFWYEREVCVKGVRWSKRVKSHSRRRTAREIDARRHAERQQAKN